MLEFNGNLLNCRAASTREKDDLGYAYWKADYQEMSCDLQRFSWKNNYGVEKIWTNRPIKDKCNKLVDTFVTKKKLKKVTIYE
jgi:hypothetical protein